MPWPAGVKRAVPSTSQISVTVSIVPVRLGSVCVGTDTVASVDPVSLSFARRTSPPDDRAVACSRNVTRCGCDGGLRGGGRSPVPPCYLRVHVGVRPLRQLHISGRAKSPRLSVLCRTYLHTPVAELTIRMSPAQYAGHRPLPELTSPRSHLNAHVPMHGESYQSLRRGCRDCDSTIWNANDCTNCLRGRHFRRRPLAHAPGRARPPDTRRDAMRDNLGSIASTSASQGRVQSLICVGGDRPGEQPGQGHVRESAR